MAVVNTSATVRLQEPEVFISTVEVAAADSDTSVYRMFKNVSSSARLTSLVFVSDAITAGTVYHVGLYSVNGGAVVDNDILAASIDFSSASVLTAPKNGLGAVAIENLGKALWQLAGVATLGAAPPAYDICLYGSTVGTADGTITGIMRKGGF
jgi:hypothetical protein